MKAEFRKKFVAALRSGDYVKVKGALCAGHTTKWLVFEDKPKCCAMGVAALLLGGTCVRRDRGWSIELTTESGGTNYFSSRLSGEALAEAGMSFSEEGDIIMRNDHGFSFEAVAAFVEMDPRFDEKESS